MRFTRFLACFALPILFALPAMAADSVWTGGAATDNWELAGNWTTGTAPDANDTAFMSNGANAIILNPFPDGGTTVGALIIDGTGTVNVNAGATFRTSGLNRGTNLGGGSYNFALGNDGGSAAATLTGDGASEHTGAVFLGASSLAGAGTTLFSGSVQFGMDGTETSSVARAVTSTGTTTWTAGNAQGNLIITGSWENQGTFNRNQNNNNGGMLLNGGGSFTNAANGIMNITGNNDFVVSGGGTFNNNGAISIDGASAELNVSGVAFNALANSSVNLANGANFIGNTTFDNADLSGSGTVTGNVIVSNGGSVSPGNSPGTLTVTGDLTVDASTVTIELGGTTAGQFDVLNVTGTLAFQNGATVALQFFGPYDLTTATAGDTFDIITAGTALTGLSASSFDFSQVGGAGAWTTMVTGTSASVTFVPEPSSLAFLGLGVMGFAFRRRRS